MKFKLIKDKKYKNTTAQALYARGVDENIFSSFLNPTIDNTNSCILLGSDLLSAAAARIDKAIAYEEKVLVIVDSDCDGYCSAAILINYFYEKCKYSFDYYLHKTKAHGLEDCWQECLKYDLIICPDSATNDIKYHQLLAEKGIDIIVLDHHIQDVVDENSKAIIINNQIGDYPNKNFCGGGVVYKFCQYYDWIDKTKTISMADNFLDLLAVSLVGDMMSPSELETHYYIQEGLKEENLKNPFIYYLRQKNSFSIGTELDIHKCAFYIVPLINAVVRSGTEQEKELVFKAFLHKYAFNMILSNKRGHKLGEEEKLVEQAIRTVTNVKNRQTSEEKSGMLILEDIMKKQNMLEEHKALIFHIPKGIINKNIAGLCANRIMGKYQRPTCVLIDDGDSYSGSARGCQAVDVNNFKDMCAETELINYASGHESAFGLSVPINNFTYFYEEIDDMLKEIETEQVYYVDEIVCDDNLDSILILDLACLNYWVDAPMIAIRNITLTKDKIKLMGKRQDTLKILDKDNISFIKFGIKQEEYQKLLPKNDDGAVKINLVGECSINNFNGVKSPQIKIKDIEIIQESKWYF